MCGIAGWLALQNAPPLPEEVLEQVAHNLRQRGPDNIGFYQNPQIGLVHTRLSIIDLSTAANQPFYSSDGRWILIYNGEIFNYIQIRKDLKEKGYLFRTNSDTEVLLNLWIDQGPVGLKKLNGFFAFAIWDSQSRTLFLARDRLGIKPLYYSISQNYFHFSSEIKGVLPQMSHYELNQEAISIYLMLTYIPAPYTGFKNIHKLPPACWMKVDSSGRFSVNQYWNVYSVNDIDYKISDQEAKFEIKEKVENAVQSWLQSDVPTGVFLSGGLDSAVITLSAAKFISGIQSFSIGFRDEPFYDETNYAQIVADKAGTRHHVISLTTHDLFQILPEVLDYIDEPFADSSALAVSILSREVKKNVTVALSGDGGDELFAGYQKHLAESLILRYPWLSSLSFLKCLFDFLPQSRDSFILNRIRQIVRLLSFAQMKPCPRYLQGAAYGNKDILQKVFLNSNLLNSWEEFRSDFCASHNFVDLNDVLKADLTMVLPDDMLVKTDRMSMMHALEVRPALLDNHVVEWALKLPINFKLRGSTTKWILREAFKEDLPQEIYHRGKRGFEVPLKKWFLGPLRNKINNEYFEKEFIKRQNVFNHDALLQLMNSLQKTRSKDAPWWIWSLIVFQHWYKKYFY